MLKIPFKHTDNFFSPIIIIKIPKLVFSRMRHRVGSKFMTIRIKILNHTVICPLVRYIERSLKKNKKYNSKYFTEQAEIDK